MCLTFGTFICTTCSGLHREFSHKVKAAEGVGYCCVMGWLVVGCFLVGGTMQEFVGSSWFG